MKIYEKLPQKVKILSIIYTTDSGYTTIRYLLSKKATRLKKMTKNLQIPGLGKNFVVVNTDPEKSKSAFIKKLKRLHSPKDRKIVSDLLENIFGHITGKKETANDKKERKKTKEIASQSKTEEKEKKDRRKTDSYVKNIKKVRAKPFFFPEPWMILTVKLRDYDREKIEKTVDKYMDSLPHRDEVEALRLLQRRNEAESRAFLYMEKYEYDYLLYKQFLDLVSEHPRFAGYDFDYTKRGYLFSFDNILKLQEVFLRRYLIALKISKSINKSRNSKNLTNVPDSQKATLKIATYTQRGLLSATLGYNKKMESFGSVSLEYSGKCTDKIFSALKIAYSEEAGESIYTLLGGKKSLLSLNTIYKFDNKTEIRTEISASRFHSQKEEYVGSSKKLEIEGIRRLRITYPDFTLRSYIIKTHFSKSERKTIINDLSYYENPDILPASYSEIGFGFLFGYDQRFRYTRRWRPFFNTSIFYNSVLNGGFSVDTGIGGPLLRKDNISFHLGYSQGFMGTEQEYIQAGIHYFYLF